MPEAAKLADLKAGLRGSVIERSDPAYDEARVLRQCVNVPPHHVHEHQFCHARQNGLAARTPRGALIDGQPDKLGHAADAVHRTRDQHARQRAQHRVERPRVATKSPAQRCLRRFR